MADKNLQKFKDVLRSEHLKVTPQRLAVFEEVCSTDDHRDADDIYLSLKQREKAVSRATVYRTVDLLLKYNFVSRIDIEDGKWRYEHWLDCTRHDHLICVRCGNIVEFSDKNIQIREKRIAKSFDYTLVRHVLNLFGYCSDCRGN